MLGKFILATIAFIDLYAIPYRMIPPQEYRKDNVALVKFVNTQDQMNLICDKLAGHVPNVNYIGCAGGDGDLKVMFIANPCNYSEDRYARSVCHELGHVNGWPGDHPNGEAFIPPVEQTSEQTHP